MVTIPLRSIVVRIEIRVTEPLFAANIGNNSLQKKIGINLLADTDFFLKIFPLKRTASFLKTGSSNHFNKTSTQ